MTKMIEVEAVSTGMRGIGKDAHRVRAGTRFTVPEGSMGSSWYVPVDPNVELPMSEKRRNRALAAEAEKKRQAEEAARPVPSTLSEITKNTPSVTPQAQAQKPRPKSDLLS